MNAIRISLVFIGLLFLSAAHAQNYQGKEKDIKQILKNIESFSNYYMNAEYQKLAECYTLDGKIFPNNADIIEGQKAIKDRWVLPENVKILKHKISPKEIRIVKDIAYDYGYYEGQTQKANGDTVSWKGKYVIVWKKVGKNWKIYLDIWNRIKSAN